MTILQFIITFCGGAAIAWWFKPTVQHYHHPPVELIRTKTETGWTFSEPDAYPPPGTPYNPEWLRPIKNIRFEGANPDTAHDLFENAVPEDHLQIELESGMKRKGGE